MTCTFAVHEKVVASPQTSTVWARQINNRKAAASYNLRFIGNKGRRQTSEEYQRTDALMEAPPTLRTARTPRAPGLLFLLLRFMQQRGYGSNRQELRLRCIPSERKLDAVNAHSSMCVAWTFAYQSSAIETAPIL